MCVCLCVINKCLSSAKINMFICYPAGTCPEYSSCLSPGYPVLGLSGEGQATEKDRGWQVVSQPIRRGRDPGPLTQMEKGESIRNGGTKQRPLCLLTHSNQATGRCPVQVIFRWICFISTFDNLLLNLLVEWINRFTEYFCPLISLPAKNSK